MTTQRQVFRIQQNTGVTTSRLCLAQHAHGPQEVRVTVRPVRSQQTLSPSTLRLAAACTGPGVPMVLYQLSGSCPCLIAYRSLAVIDRLSKEGAFIPTTDTITTPDVAYAFVPHVFSKHGIPLHVSSNHSLPLTGLNFTSGHHPSANGGRTGQQHLGTVP